MYSLSFLIVELKTARKTLLDVFEVSNGTPKWPWHAAISECAVRQNSLSASVFAHAIAKRLNRAFAAGDCAKCGMLHSIPKRSLNQRFRVRVQRSLPALVSAEAKYSTKTFVAHKCNAKENNEDGKAQGLREKGGPYGGNSTVLGLGMASRLMVLLMPLSKTKIAF
jgi:hypothetical protein